MKYLCVALVFLVLPAICLAQLQVELENNWLMWLSFITGNDEGVDQNLEDNLGWMQAQGYTHLRFFGIYPNGVHTFPSPTLDANEFPRSPTHEAILPVLVAKADQHGITVNFDGWEVIAESNRDTTTLGVGYITPDEIGAVVEEVLSYGVELISEEQFGSEYMQAIQAATSGMGAKHETTNILWWQIPGQADEQLSSVFNFYHYDQADLDTLDSFPPSNLGNLHTYAESAHYFGIPLSIAVGSFGSLEPANWKNVLLFASIQHQPERFSVEEQDAGFIIWDPDFDFMENVGDEILALGPKAFGERPIVNLVTDMSWIYEPHFVPTFYAGLVDGPAIVNAFTLLGYRVIMTRDSFLPDADLYYLLVAGGADPSHVATLPSYVMPLLNGAKPVFLHPTYGIPDKNDSPSWIAARNVFGLPGGNTQTADFAIPNTVYYGDSTVRWGGVSLWIPPLHEQIERSQVDSAVADVVVSGDVSGLDIALVIRSGDRFLINSNVIHLEASYVFSALLGGPLNRPATANIAFDENKAIVYAEYDTDIDLELSWEGQTHVMRYDPQGNMILDSVADLGGCFVATLTRGELVVMTADTSTSITEREGTHSETLTLNHGYPNPFNRATTIRYHVPPPGRMVQIRIFDVAGRTVRTLVSAFKPPGTYETLWSGQNIHGQPVSGGSYFVGMRSANHREVRKLMLIK